MRTTDAPQLPSARSLPPHSLLTVTEVAAFLGVSRAHVFRLAQESAIPQPVRISARVTRWPSAVLIAWMESSGPGGSDDAN